VFGDRRESSGGSKSRRGGLLVVELPSQDGLPLMRGGRREVEGLGYLAWGFLEGDRSKELMGGRVMRSCALVIVREGGGCQNGGEEGGRICRAVSGTYYIPAYG
jgi:hypothetical protein